MQGAGLQICIKILHRSLKIWRLHSPDIDFSKLVPAWERFSAAIVLLRGLAVELMRLRLSSLISFGAVESDCEERDIDMPIPPDSFIDLPPGPLEISSNSSAPSCFPFSFCFISPPIPMAFNVFGCRLKSGTRPFRDFVLSAIMVDAVVSASFPILSFPSLANARSEGRIVMWRAFKVSA